MAEQTPDYNFSAHMEQRFYSVSDAEPSISQYSTLMNPERDRRTLGFTVMPSK